MAFTSESPAQDLHASYASVTLRQSRGLATDPDAALERHQDAEVIAYPAIGITAEPIGGAKKRAFDLIGAITIIALASPLLLLIAALIKIMTPGPVIFGHRRVGFRSQEFQCLKFRTMVVDAEDRLAEHLAKDPSAAAEWAENQKLRNDPRITLVGKFLRKTSLDELPQLLNVVRGEMSLVGPRPVVALELSRYGRFRGAYLSTRPGMTGLWQVSGRNSTTYARRTHLDAAYVRNWRLRRDIKIILRTVPEVINSSNAS